MDFNMLTIIGLPVGLWIMALVFDTWAKHRNRGSSAKEGNTARPSEVRFGKRKLQITTTVVIEEQT